MRWLIILAILGGIGCGGYYVYCDYQVRQKQYHFGQEAQDLRQALLRLQRKIGPEEVRQVVQGFADKAGVVIEPAQITPVMQPLTPEAIKRLPEVAQMALGIAGKMKNHTKPKLLIGFRATGQSTHGPVSKSFEAERYTWWEPSY